jgi:UDP-N-acetylmuramoyl-L-alanyl-D-glutamate--2,6-diaminopimelate ligase
MRSQGATDVVLEVSSIGLSEERLYGLRFRGVVFTNLGTDHWEYHGGAKQYAAAKRRLFVDSTMHASDALCVVNADDALGAELATTAAGRVVT